MATKHVTDLMVCQAVKAYRNALTKNICLRRTPFPYETLSTQTGEPEKVCFRAMERAERRGLIDYGVSLRTGWLTEKGEALLTQEQGQ